MKLATLHPSSSPVSASPKDGRLVVVSDDFSLGLISERFATLLDAIQNWNEALPELQKLSTEILKNPTSAFSLTGKRFMAPLPRTFSWLDGSAFIQHVILVRKARGAEPPEDLFTVPLMYQGISDPLLGPQDDIEVASEEYGIDFEGEIAVIVDDVPMGTSAKDAKAHIKLLLLMNDVSLRNLIPRELATSFGFFHGKPSSSFAPCAVTPESLGESWNNGRLHLPLECYLNGDKFGSPNASEMHFSFFELIAHAAKTRHLTAGTIIGSGTVSNKDETVGSSCLAERRMLEQINTGKAKTPFMKFGDTIEMDIKKSGKSVFGRISQKVVQYKK